MVDALREAREAVRLKPNDDRVHFNLANVLAASDPAAGGARRGSHQRAAARDGAQSR